MCTVLSEKYPVAKKDYHCCACEWLNEIGITDFIRQLTFSEKKVLVYARRNNWNIKKGEKYIYQVNIWEGEFNVYKAIKSVNDLCIKYKVFYD